MLMGSMRWAVIDRFKTERKKSRIYPVKGSNTGSLKTFRQAKISRNRKGMRVVTVTDKEP